MTCHDFERLRSACPTGALPLAARDHLAACPLCAAATRADAAADATLRRLGAVPEPVDVGAARAAIRSALAAQPAQSAWRSWRRPMALAAWLAGAAAVAALLLRPAGHLRSSPPKVVQITPGPGAPGFVSSPGAPKQLAPKHAPIPFDDHRATPEAPRPRGVAPLRNALSHPAPAAIGPRLDRGPDRIVRRQRHSLPVIDIVPDHRLDRSQGAPEQPQATAPTLPSPRSAPEERSSEDLLVLNEGPLADVQPFAPIPAPERLAAPPSLAQVRHPGSVVLDDLLSLNPVRIAGVGDAGLGAAAHALATESPTIDARLQQKLYVHAINERFEDLLARLTKAAGVTLLARADIADDRVSYWADDRPLIDVMRDLRHLRGLYWSRSKQGGQWVYSLWRDAQGEAQEEAEVNRYALEQQHRFREALQKRVRATAAGEEELKRLAREDPYLVVQMLHPVIRGGYRLFASLSPDQQAALTQGQTPSYLNWAGEPLRVFPLETITQADPDHPGGGTTIFYNPDAIAGAAPRGDVVTLRSEEMTAEQRAIVAGILQGAAAQSEKANRHERTRPIFELRALKEADLATATVSLFRWGDPGWQGLSLRVDFRSGGHAWGLYSNIAVPSSSETFYNEQIRKGMLQLWPGVQDEIDRYLGGPAGREAIAPAGRETPLAAPAPADPILDAPVSLVWPLPRRDDGYWMMPQEVLAALQRELLRPMVLDSLAGGIEQPASGPGEFRWEKRPLRALLLRFFPGWTFEVVDGALFLRDPDRLRGRLNQLPPSLERFLKQVKRPLTLDDLALLARSLTLWQVAKLPPYLPQASIDQIQVAHELLKLYGELAPGQRVTLGQGLPFTALTPTQQAPFLQFAQRQRPFVAPWRFQQGSLRLMTEAVSARSLPPGITASTPSPVSRLVFEVRFHEHDSQRFPVDLYSQREWPADRPLTELVGQPFPFPGKGRTWLTPDGPLVQDAPLAQLPVRGRPLVLVIAHPYAAPYAGTQPPPAPVDWTRALAARLRETAITVVDLTIAARDPSPAPAAALPGWVHATLPGSSNGELFDPGGWGSSVQQSPTLFVIGADEVVRAVFEGQVAWDTAAVERAARSAAAPQRAASL